MHRLRSRLDDTKRAVMAIPGPLHVHGLAVMVLDHTGPACQREDLRVSQNTGILRLPAGLPGETRPLPPGTVRTGRQAIAQHRGVLQRRKESEGIFERIARLTRRELQVARLVAGGMANKVIAVELGISERTIEVHRSRAMKKLKLRQVQDL